MSKLCNIKIIRVNGDTEDHVASKRNLLMAVHKLIGVEVCDTVLLKAGKVMIVDDTGAIDGKPINFKATDLYHKKCGWVTPNSIHGDVAICTDLDFA